MFSDDSGLLGCPKWGFDQIADPVSEALHIITIYINIIESERETTECKTAMSQYNMVKIVRIM